MSMCEKKLDGSSKGGWDQFHDALRYELEKTLGELKASLQEIEKAKGQVQARNGDGQRRPSIDKNVLRVSRVDTETLQLNAKRIEAILAIESKRDWRLADPKFGYLANHPSLLPVFSRDQVLGYLGDYCLKNEETMNGQWNTSTEKRNHHPISVGTKLFRPNLLLDVISKNTRGGVKRELGRAVKEMGSIVHLSMLMEGSPNVNKSVNARDPPDEGTLDERSLMLCLAYGEPSFGFQEKGGPDMFHPIVQTVAVASLFVEIKGIGNFGLSRGLSRKEYQDVDSGHRTRLDVAVERARAWLREHLDETLEYARLQENGEVQEKVRAVMASLLSTETAKPLKKPHIPVLDSESKTPGKQVTESKPNMYVVFARTQFSELVKATVAVLLLIILVQTVAAEKLLSYVDKSPQGENGHELEFDDNDDDDDGAFPALTKEEVGVANFRKLLNEALESVGVVTEGITPQMIAESLFRPVARLVMGKMFRAEAKASAPFSYPVKSDDDDLLEYDEDLSGFEDLLELMAGAK